MQMEAASKGLRRKLCDTLTPLSGPCVVYWFSSECDASIHLDFNLLPARSCLIRLYIT